MMLIFSRIGVLIPLYLQNTCSKIFIWQAAIPGCVFYRVLSIKKRPLSAVKTACDPGLYPAGKTGRKYPRFVEIFFAGTMRFKTG
jgi:hypothetical protein